MSVLGLFVYWVSVSLRFTPHLMLSIHVNTVYTLFILILSSLGYNMLISTYMYLKFRDCEWYKSFLLVEISSYCKGLMARTIHILILVYDPLCKFNLRIYHLSVCYEQQHHHQRSQYMAVCQCVHGHEGSHFQVEVVYHS